MRHLVSTLQFKLTLGYGIILLALIATLTTALKGRIEAVLQQNTLQQVEASGAAIVAELQRRQTLVNTLAQSLANFSETAHGNAELIHKGFPQLLNLASSSEFIAGGGFWPEPNTFSPDKVRSSFFWGRNASGEFEYYDDYNSSSGPGYHHEEWYVPAQYLNDGHCYWSQSYTDPYSGQPMVTCTVAANLGGQYIGAATVDLRLEGLAEFISALTANSESYAFLVDQHNRFITYPDSAIINNGENGRFTSHQLGQFSPAFTPLASVLEQVRTAQIAGTTKAVSAPSNLVGRLAEASYQIEPFQAEMIVTALAAQNQPTPEPSLARITLKNDLRYNEAATAHIFHVPQAYWKVVVVTQNSQLFTSVNKFIGNTLLLILAPLIFIMILAFLLMRRMLITPLYKITSTLRQSSEGLLSGSERLDDSRKDELGQLAYWYNRRTEELSDTMQKLSSVNDKLSHEANYDYLTNLTSRRQFERHLQALIDNGEWDDCALLYLDLDQFKVINDTCGHLAGDQLLIQVGECLKKIRYSDDLVARIGGDEFAVITRSATRNNTGEYATRVVQYIQGLVFEWDGKVFPVSCSIGVVQLSEVEKVTTTAMRYVDNSCYAAKDSGRNDWYMYTADTGLIEQREGEMNWLAQINTALDNDAFFTVFQLIWPTRSETHTLPAAEALVRLKMPDGTVAPPGAFLPAAERYGAVARIDKWMINHTLAVLASHRDALDNLRFCSINLSAALMCQTDMLSYISSTLKQHHIPAHKICFEITENQIMLNLTQAKQGLQALRELGCHVALDDFGTGMSSYSYLQELPIDHLKIDGHFVKNITTDPVQRAFVKSIREIAGVMDLETIAEFVESDDVYGMLREIGVTYAQGYAIAKPMHIKEMMALVESGKLNRLQL